MVIILKLCVTALVLVTGAGADDGICHVSVLMAQSTPQILTSETLATIGVVGFISCTVQMTVSAGSSLKLNFTSIGDISNIEIFRMDPSIPQPFYVGVTFNLDFPNPPIYVFPGSVYVSFTLAPFPGSEFTMEYQEVAFEENICTVGSPVLADTTAREIVTPNFGNGPYFDNEMCQVTIQSSNGASEVKVEVTNHDMDCPFDTITICDGVDCHNLCSTNQRNFSGNSITVTFSSDSINGFPGMRLEYIAVSEISDWTPWVSMGCCEYRNCQMFVKDKRTRNCLSDTCQDELVQDRTRVCSRKCAD